MLFSNEIVFRGHPDKVCDQISDAILDAYLKKDPYARCAVETMGGKGKIFLTGEISSTALVPVEEIVRRVLIDVGYDTSYEIINNIGKQSPDIAMGTKEEVGGAGDQGLMFGYACDDTVQLLPTAMVILKELSQWYDLVQRENEHLFPDGKAQITAVYSADRKLQRIRCFVISYQNDEKNRSVTDQLIIDQCNAICQKYQVAVDSYLLNPTGRFALGGFAADSGLSGRKIVVDTYQGFAPVGGGSFSGKDPTKVDRSAQYQARQIAKEYLIQYHLKWCLVQLAYVIGKKAPVSIFVVSDKGYLDVEQKYYQICQVPIMIEQLQLRQICYEEKARYGQIE